MDCQRWQITSIPLAPGTPTSVCRFNGHVVTGSNKLVSHLPRSLLISPRRVCTRESHLPSVYAFLQESSQLCAPMLLFCIFKIPAGHICIAAGRLTMLAIPKKNRGSPRTNSTVIPSCWDLGTFEVVRWSRRPLSLNC